MCRRFCKPHILPELSAFRGGVSHFERVRQSRAVAPSPGAPERDAGADSGGSAGARSAWAPGADSGGSAGARSAWARAGERDAGADPTGRSAKSPVPEHDSGGHSRAHPTHPTLVARGAGLRGVGDGRGPCRLRIADVTR